MKPSKPLSETIAKAITYMDTESLKSVAVHPSAGTYEMCPEDKQNALAEDIAQPSQGKRTGQIHPIILRKVDGAFELIDGRNRLEACRRAGVKVLVEILELNDKQARKLINSLNNQRRQMSHREQAEVAWAYYDAQKSSGGKVTQEQVAKKFGIALRTFMKWRPNGKEAELSDSKKGNNNNRYPINSMYRRHAYMLSQLLLKPWSKLNNQEVKGLGKEIERLFANEFPKA
jgi:hypothetical protein